MKVKMPTPGQQATRRSRCTTSISRHPRTRSGPGRWSPGSTGTLCSLPSSRRAIPTARFRHRRLRRRQPGLPHQRIAEHTKNLERDPRASLLVAEGGAADPLANGRVMMLGPCTRFEPQSRQRAGRILRRPSELHLLRRLPRFRILEAASGSRPAISVAMAGCRGSARPTGRPPSRTRSVHLLATTHGCAGDREHGALDGRGGLVGRRLGRVAFGGFGFGGVFDVRHEIVLNSLCGAYWATWSKVYVLGCCAACGCSAPA